MESIAKFRNYYNLYLHSELAKFDQKRKWLVVQILLAFGGGIWLSIYVFLLRVPALIIFLLIPWTGIWWYLNKEIKTFKGAYKPLVVQSILHFIDPRFRYHHNSYINRDTFDRSGIFPFSPRFYSGEDYITGKVGEVFFELCELKISHTIGFKQKVEKVFEGVFFHAKFNTPFQGRVMILPRQDWQNLVGTMRDFARYGGFEIKNLGDDSFQKEFIVYADKGVRYNQVLNRDLIDTIHNYHLKSGKKVYASFVNAHFFFGVEEQKKVLDASIFSANIDFRLLRAFYEELYLFTSLVRDFDLQH